MQEVTSSFVEESKNRANQKPVPSKPQPKKKGVDRNLLNLISEIRSDYYLFIEEYPEYEFPLPNLKDEKDVLALHEQLEYQKKMQRFEYSVRDLPVNYSYAVFGISGLGKKYAKKKDDQALLDRWGRFEEILQKSYDDLNPMLVETLKLYPFLQRQKPHVLLRLGLTLKFMWDLSAEKTSEPVKIPEDF